MRLGLSNKITQPYLRGAVVASAGIERTSIVLNLSDTWVGPNSLETRLPTNATNTDGRYYNVEFPFSWEKWDQYTYGSVPSASNVVDPFSAYREAGDPVIDGAGKPSLPPINANLDITINIDSGTVIGGYTSYYTYGLGAYPSFQLYYSNSGTYSSFTEEAAKNLKITINNSGSIGGAGGLGGWGDNDDVAKSVRDYGGGGGSGVGIHRRAGESENDWSGSGTTGTSVVAGVAGAPGGGNAYAGTQGRWNTSASIGVIDDYASSYPTGIAGSGGVATTDDTDDLSAVRSGGGAGSEGGIAISIRNPLAQLLNGSSSGTGTTWATDGTYASDWVSNWSGGGGPELIINNNSDGYIRGGGGGGGGGGAGFSGGAGGLIGANGAYGGGNVSGADIRGDGGLSAKSVGVDWPGRAAGYTQPYGNIEKNNANSDTHSFYPDGA